MISNLVILPLIVPVFTALTLLLIGRSRFWRRWIGGLSTLAQVFIALMFVAGTYQLPPFMLEASGWAAPFGIVLVIDHLTAIMLSLGAISSLAVQAFSFAEVPTRRTHPLRAPLIQFLITGINLSFCTADLFNLFVGFEVMLIASYGLLTLEADDWDIRQAFPYLAINLFGSTLFLVAAGFAYSLFGSLNFAQIAQLSAEMSGDPRVTLLGLMLLLVFGLKSGLFPLYYWLPNSYPILPTPVAALYAGMLTKVGAYVLLRVFGQVLPVDLKLVHQCLAWMAGATMVLGAIGAVSRTYIRGILSFQVISGIGSIALAIGFFTEFAITAAIYYIVQDIVVKGSLFLIGGTVGALNETDDLDKTGGLWKAAPFLGVVFLLQALSLAGIPPFSGFWGKYMIILEGVRLGQWVLVTCALVAGFLTLFAMLKIWRDAFWRDPKEVDAVVDLEDQRWKYMTAVIAGMVVLSLGIGLGAEWVLKLADEASRQLLDRPTYISYILGGKPPVKFLGLNLIIASIWLLLQDHPTFATFVIGGGLGFALIFLFRDVLDSRDYTRRVAALFAFAGIFFWQFAVAARDLLRIVLFSSMKDLKPRMITYDVSDLKTYELLILCHLITLTPGSSVVSLAKDHSILVLHVLNTTNPDAVRDEIDQTLKRGLLAITR